MKTSAIRFQEAINQFPKVPAVLAKLDEAKIPYAVGGSVALYTQGNSRKPHDVDIMLVNEAHDAANVIFGLKSEIIVRPNVSMHKSSPVDDGSLDFLSHYTVIMNGVGHHTQPLQKVPVEFEGRQINLIPAEKIVVIKLIGRREHHHDTDDVKELMRHPEFDKSMFWEMVDLLQARDDISELLRTYNIDF